jgi:hypothetical protein
MFILEQVWWFVSNYRVSRCWKELYNSIDAWFGKLIRDFIDLK